MKYKNNPLNIRYSPLNKWIGLCGHRNGFCEFETLEYGVRAVCILLMRSYRKRGFKTYSQIIDRFAPPSENPTDTYLDFVCTRCGSFPWDIPFLKSDFARLISAMSLFEQGTFSAVPYVVVLDVIDKFKIDIYG